MQDALFQELRTQSEQLAHTLAGSLGTFGFSNGSQLARKIEHLLLNGKSLGTKEAKQLHKLVLALRQEIEHSPLCLATAAQTNKDERPKLLIVDSDRQLAQELIIKADIQGIRTEVATNLSVARDMIDRDS